ncbi:MAG: class I SAM-dependent methyltransferase [Acidimicrobiia bacterium]|nr:class I SAM-dependent methyltransferase [Acidimicrobiia bacterium]
MSVFSWAQKPAPEATGPSTGAVDEVEATSKVFPRFLSAVAQQALETRPVILELGPVVGANVEFFSDRLACKLYIENLYLDLEEAARLGTRAGLAEAFLRRLALAGDMFDGILCWDLFDFIDAKTGKTLAGELARLLKPGGAVYGFFGTTPIELCRYTRYVIESESRFRLQHSPATPVKRNVLLTRDITKMFEGLSVSESVLLKSSTRETLFRR